MPRAPTFPTSGPMTGATRREPVMGPELSVLCLKNCFLSGKAVREDIIATRNVEDANEMRDARRRRKVQDSIQVMIVNSDM